MDSRIKIVLINHTFQIDFFYKRWKILADSHPNLDITLLAPEEWTWGNDKTLTFGNPETKKGKKIDNGNFHIHPIDIIPHKFRSWTSKLLKKELKQINPDIIYHIGLHTQDSLYQVINYAKWNLPKTKVIAFSMRGPYHDNRVKKNKTNVIKWFARRVYYVYRKIMLAYINRNCDAIFCHYPEAVDSFRREGYKGPIYMQTQVGVDTDIFKPDEIFRKEIRDKYNIEDSFVFGSATRFAPDKGLSDIIEAMPKDGNWKYLMIGAGLPEEEEIIKKLIIAKGLQDKIILTGYVNRSKMPAYWNAIDCAIHTPRTTENWVETFSLAVVQAMATGKPVIGNSSGSVPYQVGADGIIIEEGDIQALHDKIAWIIEHPEDAQQIGSKMMNRAVNCFSIRHLNDLFYKTIIDVHNDTFNPNNQDMTMQYTNL